MSTFQVPIRDISAATRAQNNSRYLAYYTFDVSRYDPSDPSNASLLTPLDTGPWADRFQPLSTLDAVDGLRVGRLRWTPSRGQEGLRYRLCARVRDGCGAARDPPQLSVCVDAEVVKCRSCLAPGASMQVISCQS